MNTEDINPALAYLYTALMLAGLVCLSHHYFFGNKESSLGPKAELAPWNIRGLDLALILTFIFLFIYAAGALTMEGYYYYYGTKEVTDEHQFIFGFPMHIAILASLYGFFRYFKFNETIPFNPTRSGTVTLFLKAAYFFLAGLPILILGGWLWPYVLEFLRLPTDPQDLVTQVGHMSFSPVFLMVAFLAVFLAPLSEEFLFRGFIYRSLKSYLPAWASATLTSLMFAGMHFNWLSFLPLFLLGLWLCRTYEKTGNLWVPVILHGLFNGNTLVILMLMHSQS